MLRYLLIGIGGLMAIGATIWFFQKAPLPEDTDQQPSLAAARRLAPREDSLCKTWLWLGMEDDYKKGDFQAADSTHPKWLQLNCNGSFRRFTPHLMETGQWRRHDSLNLIALQTDPQPVRWDPDSYRHKIEKLTSDTLILAWQGRHGWVRDWYRSTSAADSIPVHPLQ